MKARAAALGGDEAERCAATTVQAQRAKPSTAKDTKNHEGTQSAQRKWNRRFLRTQRTQRRQRGTEAGGVLPYAGLPECFSITKDTEDTVQAQSAKPSTAKTGDAGAGRACAQGTRPARGPVEAWRASHATLWFLGVHRRQPPSYMSYRSYRDGFWQVADVPGVQGELLPAGVWGSAPYPPIS